MKPRATGYRRGATAVEFALILPVFLALVFGLIEISRVRMTSNMLDTACQMAARYGSAEGVSTADVRARLAEILATAMNPNKVTVFVKDASQFDGTGSLPSSMEAVAAMPDIDLEDAEPGTLFLVRTSIRYHDIALIRFPYLDSLSFVGQSYSRHE